MLHLRCRRQGSFSGSLLDRLDMRIARENGVAPEAIEVWFADEARVGQKNKITPPMGQARHAPERSQRSANGLRLYLRRDLPWGADGKGAALVMP